MFLRGLDLKEYYGMYTAKMFEQLQSESFAKIHGVKRLFKSRLHDMYMKYRKVYMHYNILSQSISALDGVVSTFIHILLFVLCGFAIVRGNMTVGSFIIFSALGNRLITCASYFFNIGKGYQNSLVSYERIKSLLSWDEDIDADIILESISTISIESLSFSYGDKQIFNDLSISFERGKSYALIGKNGTGKTTLINILIGVYIATDGRVLINGSNINKLNMSWIRQYKIGIVEQEPVLLNDTILYNLTLGENIQKETLNQVIELLELTSFINKQSEGLDTMISPSNTNISGGERQKIALARLILRNPDVLILDEPTSALDQKSENYLIEYLEAVRSEKIIIIISHTKNVIEWCCEKIHVDTLEQNVEFLYTSI